MTLSCMHTFQCRTGEPGPGQGRSQDLPGQAPGRSADPDPVIRCRRCLREITRNSERVQVAGAHRHTFANPHGLVFEIGCFRSVRHCSYTGPPSLEFTWFPGYNWRIVHCGRCLTHLGWVFAGSGKDPFHGLILDHLIETQ